MAVNSRRFQLNGTTATTCHTIHCTQCKHTIHVHNWDIYGIFRSCHVNLWSNQAIKSCCQQAKTVTLKKIPVADMKFYIHHFNAFFPSASCFMLFMAFELVFYGTKRIWLNCLKCSINFSHRTYFYKTYFLQVIILRSHAKRGRHILRVNILI